MKRLGLLLCALVLLCWGLGCASDSGGSWDEVWKDLRGDNMKMRGDTPDHREDR
jgi:hypothetical protein